MQYEMFHTTSASIHLLGSTFETQDLVTPGLPFAVDSQRFQWNNCKGTPAIEAVAVDAAALASGKSASCALLNKRLKADFNRQLLNRLDSLLPAKFKGSAQPRCAGKRSVGNSGRSATDIMQDCLSYIKCLRPSTNSFANQEVEVDVKPTHFEQSTAALAKSAATPQSTPHHAQGGGAKGAKEDKTLAADTPEADSGMSPLKHLLLSSHTMFYMEVEMVCVSVIAYVCLYMYT
jgi:hypothetical protein